MSDFFEKVSGQIDPFKKLVSYIPVSAAISNDKTAATQTRFCVIPLPAASKSIGDALQTCRLTWSAAA